MADVVVPVIPGALKNKTFKMPVSSDVLTHFTKYLNNLEGILKDGFIPKLCTENYIFCKIPRTIQIPMVCFCDIPLHLIQEHISYYGPYGLALSKEWGIRNGLNPIVYLEKDSVLSETFERLIFDITDSISEEISIKKYDKYEKITSNIYKILCFLKPYQGTGKYEDEKLFYEENEWRYIPKTLSKGDKLSVPYFDDQIVTDAIKHKHEVENFIIDEPLKFEPEDIRYIFIDDDKERMNVIKMIKRIKSTKYPRDQIDILCSKIMSYNQLKKDV